MIFNIKDLIKSVFTRPIINIYNTHFKKNILISYITYPFREYKKNNYIRHTNYQESKIIAEIFRKEKFNVDIYDYNYSGKLDYKKYEVIFGFGDPLCKSFYNRKNNIITIYYGTGMHVCVQNTNTLKRIKEVYKKKGVWIPESGRIVEKNWGIQTTLVDAIITLGNNSVLKSYSKYYDGPIYILPVTFYDIIDNKIIENMINIKNYEKAKYNFLWFGGSGLIHKGLDLLLELFINKPHWNLHICGPVKNEKNFVKAYYNELYNYPNIHTYDKINLKSSFFKNLMNECLFVVFPSCSEGGGASVINVMANGLIPIVTKESSVNIDDFGYSINGFDILSIENSIEIALETHKDDLRQRSFKSYIYTRKNHSKFVYKKKLEAYLRKILI